MQHTILSQPVRMCAATHHASDQSTAESPQKPQQQPALTCHPEPQPAPQPDDAPQPPPTPRAQHPLPHATDPTHPGSAHSRRPPSIHQSRMLPGITDTHQRKSIPIHERLIGTHLTLDIVHRIHLSQLQPRPQHVTRLLICQVSGKRILQSPLRLGAHCLLLSGQARPRRGGRWGLVLVAVASGDGKIP